MTLTTAGRGDKQRGAVPLRALVGLLALANVYGIWLGTTHRSELVETYPRLAAVWPAYLACPVVSLVALAAVWRMRRWGVWLALFAGAVVMGIELYACGPAPHTLRVPVAMMLLLFAVRPLWARLR